MMKVEEVSVNVHNFFLIKEVTEDDGKLVALGTFIQHCFEDEKTRELVQGKMNAKDDDDDDDDDYVIEFEYRLNDEIADSDTGYIKHRRTEKYDTDMGTLYRHTYQVKAPLDLKVELDYFPFRVVSAKLLVELSTFTTPDNATRLRPNLILHLLDKTNMFSIQKDAMKVATGSVFAQAKDRMDHTENYDFISPFPKVSYLYDQKKRYCPKFLMTFMMVEDGMKKFVEIVAPMFLIAGMNTINVLNEIEENDIGDYIANSATFALSVLVFLPTMVGTSRIQQLWTTNNLYIMFIFVGLALSSIPDPWAGSYVYAFVGMLIYWASFLFPIVNSVRYLLFIRKAKNLANPNHFWAGKNKKAYKASNPEVSHEFAKIEEIVFKPEEDRTGMEYELRDVHKFKVLEFASMGGTKRSQI